MNSESLINHCRNTWLINWLANISGRENAFKEMDLLQEHQNFWDKVLFHQFMSRFNHNLLDLGYL
jgi:hypothetical protein